MHVRARHSRHNEACRTRIYNEIKAKAKDLQPEEERRLETKTKLSKEPKPEEPLPEVSTPDTPKGDIENLHLDEDMDATGDEVIVDHEDLPDVEDSGMIDNTTDFYREVDEAMDGEEEMHEDTTMTAMMDVLQTLGVDVSDANKFSARAVRVARKASNPSFVEAYGTGLIVERANGVLRNLNVKGLAAFDLRTRKANGTPWNFSKSSDREEAVKYIRENRPTWVIGSPPCTAFSMLQGLNFKKMAPERVKAILNEGRRHLHFVISLYKLQLDEGRHFLHEHPQGASSWKDVQMLKLLNHPRVKTTVSDQCQYGLVTPGPGGDMMPAKKPTKWASSSPQMLARLSKRCAGDHEHQHLMGGRAAQAAFYPPPLVTNILRGMRDTADSEHVEAEHDYEMNVAMLRAGSLQDIPAYSLKSAYRESDMSHQNAKLNVRFQYLNGTSANVDLNPNFRDVYKDEYTTEPLPKEGTKAAMHDEISYFCDKVFRGVTYDEAAKDPSGKIIRSRWVNSNKAMLKTQM